MILYIRIFLLINFFFFSIQESDPMAFSLNSVSNIFSIFKMTLGSSTINSKLGPPQASGGSNSPSTFGTFFSETASNKQVPRALFVDLEPSVVGKYDQRWPL
jgi:hypothetical protein